MSVTIKDICWLAGLLEGEGYFTLSRNDVCIGINMTDQDIIERVAVLWGTNVNERSHSENRKTPYTTTIHSKKAIQWMFTLYPLLGNRRRTKIESIIQSWKDVPTIGMGIGYLNKIKTECIKGHPFNEDNTYIEPMRGNRQCKICRADRARAYYERHRESK